MSISPEEVEKRLTKRGSEIEIDQVMLPPKQIRVMLIGKLENPKIECLRELFHQESNSKIIPLCVKKSVAQQKFRIPFKNLSETLDADLDFTFVKLASASDDQVDLTPHLEFYCQPSNLKLPAGQQQFLNVLIKVNTHQLSEVKSGVVNKLLIGRVKDSSVLFSYFLSVNIINQ